MAPPPDELPQSPLLILSKDTSIHQIAQTLQSGVVLGTFLLLTLFVCHCSNPLETAFNLYRECCPFVASLPPSS